MINKEELTVEMMLEEIQAIQPMLNFGRGRLIEFMEVLETMEVTLPAVNTYTLWQRSLSSLIVLKGHLSATQEIMQVWREKIFIFQGYMNKVWEGNELPQDVSMQTILDARNHLADLSSEIVHQSNLLSVQMLRLDKQMQILEKKRTSVHTPLRDPQAPRLKVSLYNEPVKEAFNI